MGEKSRERRKAPRRQIWERIRRKGMKRMREKNRERRREGNQQNGEFRRWEERNKKGNRGLP